VHYPGSIRTGSHLAGSHNGLTCHDIYKRNTQCLDHYERSALLVVDVCESHAKGLARSI
jgi:hypothetical protein